MATIVTLDGVTPEVGADVYLAPTATLIGDVHIGARSSNQRCSQRSVWINSPRHARRARGCWIFGGRSLRGIHRPASIWIRRTVSLANTI